SFVFLIAKGFPPMCTSGRDTRERGAIVIVKVCVSAGGMPLLAVTTIPPHTPAAVGGPLSPPSGASGRPGGTLPAVRLKVGVGEPVAVKVWRYAAPTAGEAGGELVITGAVNPIVISYPQQTSVPFARTPQL